MADPIDNIEVVSGKRITPFEIDICSHFSSWIYGTPDTENLSSLCLPCLSFLPSCKSCQRIHEAFSSGILSFLYLKKQNVLHLINSSVASYFFHLRWKMNFSPPQKFLTKKSSFFYRSQVMSQKLPKQFLMSTLSFLRDFFDFSPFPKRGSFWQSFQIFAPTKVLAQKMLKSLLTNEL